MITINLTREEIEQAIVKYAEDNILGYAILKKNTVKVTQGKSAVAKIILVPNEATKEETEEALSQSEKELEAVAGQPDVPEEHMVKTKTTTFA